MLSVVKTASRKNGLRVLSYYWDGQQNDGLWMSPPDEPKSADRWSRIVTILVSSGLGRRNRVREHTMREREVQIGNSGS